jgi:hypothetical protein
LEITKRHRIALKEITDSCPKKRHTFYTKNVKISKREPPDVSATIVSTGIFPNFGGVKTLIFLYSLLFILSTAVGQRTYWEKSDSLNRRRALTVTAGLSGYCIGSMVGLQAVWYSQVEKAPFHTFNDASEWLQMDKAGHIYTANKLSTLSGELWQWSGIKPKKAALFGTLLGVAYQTTFEIFDGFSKNWGFSWSDMAANGIGSGIYLGQALAWNEQRILLKFSCHPTEYAALRPNVLGSNFQERLLKDYNGQTYWLSINPSMFLPEKKLPPWLCISLGYSVNAKLVGDENNYMGYTAQREFLLSLDVDFSRIPVKKPWLKALLKQLNYLKLPFPTLLYRDGKWLGYGCYF